MTTTTTNYGWTKPDVGASTDAWGGLLNTDLDGIDSTVKTVSNVANAALPSATASSTYVAKAGDTMTGALNINGAAGTGRNLFGQTAGVNRWQVTLGTNLAEGGSNAGSNFQLTGYTDAGGVIGTALGITRSNFNAQFGASIGAVGGYYCQSGLSGTQRINRFNIDWTTGAQLWIDNSNTGTITVSSDYRIKKDVADLPSMWERAKALRPISYTHQDFTPPVELQRDAEAKPLIVGDDIERWGFIAHELQETLIQDAATGEKDSPTHIQSPNPWTVIATLTKALQEAMTRVEALEAARG